jgi:hypothetical protein
VARRLFDADIDVDSTTGSDVDSVSRPDVHSVFGSALDSEGRGGT